MLTRRDLDDRRFNDILSEMTVRAREMFPEWSNFNPSDPGLTLLELFVWLKEMQQFHLNRTHPRTLEKLLAMLGGQVRRVTPATALVSVTAPSETVLLPGTVLDAHGVPFETEASTVIYPHKIIALFTRDETGQLTPPKPPAEDGADIMMLPSSAGAAFYIGFDRGPPVGTPFGLFFDLRDDSGRNPPCAGFDSDLAVLRWQAMDSNGYFDVTVIADETQRLLYPGLVTLVFERETAPSSATGLEGVHILRVTLEQSHYEMPRRLAGLYLNNIAVRQTDTLYGLPVAAGDGMPRQRYRLNLTPPLDLESAELTVSYELWTRVDHFDASGPSDTHYVLDETQGIVSFGDGERGCCPDGEIVMRRVSQTLGAGGNVKAGAIGCFVPPMPWLCPSNSRPAEGGTDAGTVEEAFAELARFRRGPEKAVTAEDYEALTLATPGLALRRAKAMAGGDKDNTVVVTAQPYGTRDDTELNEGYRRAIARYLDRFRLITTRVRVVPPCYIYVDMTLEAYANELGSESERAMRDAVKSFFRALGFGNPVYYTELYGMLGALCRKIVSLSLTPASWAGTRTRDGGIAPPPQGILILRDLELRLYTALP